MPKRRQADTMLTKIFFPLLHTFAGEPPFGSPANSGGDVVKNIIFALLKAQEYAGRKDTY